MYIDEGISGLKSNSPSSIICALKQKMSSSYCDNVVLKKEMIDKEVLDIVLNKIYSEEKIRKIFELYKKDYELMKKEWDRRFKAVVKGD